jgi:predicted DNA-binding transcriptional regulator AlpA
MDTQYKILTTKEVLRLCRISPATLYRSVLKQSGFPQPFKIGLQKNAWLRADIETWLTSSATNAGVCAN